MLEDRLVKLIAGDTDGLGDDDTAHGDDRDLGGTATDVDDHGTRGLLNGQVSADGCGHGLLDEVGLARTGLDGGLEHGALLDGGDAGGHAHDDARARGPGIALLTRLVDEVAKHGLGHIEVGDDAVLERTDGDDVAGRAAEHAFGLDTDSQDALVVLIDCDDGGLADDDALAAHGDEGVGCTEVDRQIAVVLTEKHIHQRKQVCSYVKHTGFTGTSVASARTSKTTCAENASPIH